MRIPRVTASGPWSPLTAAWEAVCAASERQAAVRGLPPVRVTREAAGPVVSLDTDGRQFVQLAGAGNPYTGTVVFPAAPGLWTPYGTGGTLTCYEDNGVAGLAGKVVRVRPAAGEWRFRYKRMTGTAGVTHQMPGCPCATIPDVIFMHVASQPTNGLESLVFPATLQWQPKPALISGYGTDPVGYYSTTAYVSSAGSYKFYYWFTCSQGTYVVRGVITPDSPNGFPGQFLIMTWLPGFPGNTCNPFSLHNGSSLNQAYQMQGITIDSTGPP